MFLSKIRQRIEPARSDLAAAAALRQSLLALRVEVVGANDRGDDRLPALRPAEQQACRSNCDTAAPGQKESEPVFLASYQLTGSPKPTSSCDTL